MSKWFSDGKIKVRLLQDQRRFHIALRLINFLWFVIGIFPISQHSHSVSALDDLNKTTCMSCSQ